jgi:hypothetical protein
VLQDLPALPVPPALLALLAQLVQPEPVVIQEPQALQDPLGLQALPALKANEEMLGCLVRLLKKATLGTQERLEQPVPLVPLGLKELMALTELMV